MFAVAEVRIALESFEAELVESARQMSLESQWIGSVFYCDFEDI